MTDDTPVPPWLTPSDDDCAPKGEGFMLAGESRTLVVDAVQHGEKPDERTLPEWLRWRLELAEALGLVGLEHVARAVAAELRAQADEHWKWAEEHAAEQHTAPQWLLEQLRARADELDPQGPPELSMVTGVDILCPPNGRRYEAVVTRRYFWRDVEFSEDAAMIDGDVVAKRLRNEFRGE